MDCVPLEHQHIRFNPLNRKWILVCPHRMNRPWSGQQEEPQKFDFSGYENNPLAPGAFQSSGQKNLAYTSTFVFTNDLAAYSELEPSETHDVLFQTRLARGTCKTICYQPKVGKAIALLTPKEIRNIIDEWIKQFIEHESKYLWVQIFENKGISVGCSNMHPHAEIWACSFLPTECSIKDKQLRKYYDSNGRSLLDDYIRKELIKKERIVIDNPDWLVVVPFWASWPFEIMIISRNNNKRISDLSIQQINNLSIVLKELTTKYDNLFKSNFPYTMGWYGAPTGNFSNCENSHWTLHAIYYPPLLRSAKVRKFMVGFEMLCQPQRDLTPEEAARRLREVCGKRHYTEHVPD